MRNLRPGTGPASSGWGVRPGPFYGPGPEALDQHEAAHVRRTDTAPDVDAVRARFTD